MAVYLIYSEGHKLQFFTNKIYTSKNCWYYNGMIDTY
jgi:hypothetical protein